MRQALLGSTTVLLACAVLGSGCGDGLIGPGGGPYDTSGGDPRGGSSTDPNDFESSVGGPCGTLLCTDADPDYECGEWDDGCGGTVECGTCTGGNVCDGTGQCVAPADLDFFVSRTTCTRPCAIFFDAQATENLGWKAVSTGEFYWDFDADAGTHQDNDSEGYLAAHVYETAGTYTATLTVDGQKWRTQQIVVSDPTEVICVSATSNFDGCPSGSWTQTKISNGDLATAWAQLGPNEHLLIEAGQDWGTFAVPGSSLGASRTFGAYFPTGVTAKPIINTGHGIAQADFSSIMDLDLRDSSWDQEGQHTLVLRVDLYTRQGESGSAPFGDGPVGWQWDERGKFYIGPHTWDFNTKYGVYQGGYYIAVKDTESVAHHSRDSAGKTYDEHNFRFSGVDKLLVQDSEIERPDWSGNTALTVRGSFSANREYSRWGLIQNNYLYGRQMALAHTHDSSVTIDNMLVERNIVDGGGLYMRTESDHQGESLSWHAIKVAGSNSLMRNNVAYETSRGFAAYTDGVAHLATANNHKFYNNVLWRPRGEVVGHGCGAEASFECLDDIAGCEVVGNIVYASDEATCGIANDQVERIEDNWVYIVGDPDDSDCRVPGMGDGLAGTAYCVDPGFIEVDDYTHPDFMRPANTSGMDAADEPIGRI